MRSLVGKLVGGSFYHDKMAAGGDFWIVGFAGAGFDLAGYGVPAPTACPLYRPGRILVYRYRNLTLGLGANLWLDEFSHQISFQSAASTTDWHGCWSRDGTRLCPPHLVTT